jgi:hypothetical protein
MSRSRSPAVYAIELKRALATGFSCALAMRGIELARSTGFDTSQTVAPGSALRASTAA